MIFCCSPTDPMDCEERATCETPGAAGHYYCGVCDIHGKPRHSCGDVLILETPSNDGTEIISLKDAWAELEASLAYDRDC